MQMRTMSVTSLLEATVAAPQYVTSYEVYPSQTEPIRELTHLWIHLPIPITLIQSSVIISATS